MHGAIVAVQCFTILLLYTYGECSPVASTGHSDIYVSKTVTNCVSSCEDMPNGDYQSCHGCHVYVTCSNEVIYDIRLCPWILQWDDSTKRCTWLSSTCRQPEVKEEKMCVDTCMGKQNGDYQSCTGCGQYITCSNGFHYTRACPVPTIWDDNWKVCGWSSSTCSDEDD